jgi:hypothetical protein
MAVVYGMVVTGFPSWWSSPVEMAKVRSLMSTVSVAGSIRTFEKVVRTSVPGAAPPAVYCEKLPAPRVTYSRGVPAMSWQ